MASGKLVIFSAPSGAGKTTIVRHLLSKNFNLEFSVSATSRKPRGAEKHGLDYYFLSSVDFKEKIDNNAFLEWEEVYSGTFYGTLKSEVDRITAKGGNVIFDVDVVGGLNIKKSYGERALAIFIMPPSVEELKKRLTSRATDSELTIQNRIAKAEYELTFSNQFDAVVINDNLEKAISETETLVQQFLEQT